MEEPGRGVEDPHLVAPGEQAPDQMAAGEPGAAGDERAHAPSISGVAGRRHDGGRSARPGGSPTPAIRAPLDGAASLAVDARAG